LDVPSVSVVSPSVSSPLASNSAKYFIRAISAKMSSCGSIIPSSSSDVSSTLFFFFPFPFFFFFFFGSPSSPVSVSDAVDFPFLPLPFFPFFFVFGFNITDDLASLSSTRSSYE
jgi:hypothetical protein